MTPTTDQLKDLLAKVTPGGWTGHNMVHSETGKQMTPEEIGEYVCRSVGMGDPSRFLFVSGKHDDGGDCDVCHTGNGPSGPFNTALIALAPTLAAEVVRLREALEEIALQDQFNCRRNGEIVPDCGLCGQIARQALDATSDA